MEYGFIIIVPILVAVVCGFAFLALVLLKNWRAQSRGKEEVDAEQSRRTRDFEECLNRCMASQNGDPAKDETCRALCRS